MVAQNCWRVGLLTVVRLSFRRGQYSDAVLSELESQNDQQVEGILGKVKILKDVSGSLGPSLALLPNSGPGFLPLSFLSVFLSADARNAAIR